MQKISRGESMKKNIKKISKKSLKNSLEKIWSPKSLDPDGSYTGSATDGKRPVQDADDL